MDWLYSQNQTSNYENTAISISKSNALLRIFNYPKRMGQQILIIEDDHMQRKMLTTLLRRKLNVSAKGTANGHEALQFLQTNQGKTIQLIIMDLDMPVMGGMETLAILKQKHPSIPVIILTGSQDINDAVHALKNGATDFITKPYEANRITITVQNALKIGTLSKELSRLKSEKDGTFTFENLIGHDGGLMPIVHLGRKAAGADLPVLITGETGTGKEVFARAIHGESKRTGKPFIAVNCGAIPSQLVESTLFGHEKGAFTGATEKTIGKFREAEGGTIFLDEVGELPLDTQVKLLRVLQQQEVEPVGAGKPVPVNVRIISATNRDLEKEIQDRNFREDLYFRLNVLQMELSALRKRTEDIPALTHHFVERFCSHENAIPKSISKTTLNNLQCYDWPGNIRQLENKINRAMVMSEGDILKIDDLGELITSPEATQSDNQPDGAYHINLMRDSDDFKTIEDIEYEAMHIALNYFDQNITQTAKALGIAKSTFYRKMKT